MASTAAILRLRDLRPRQASAIKQKAQRLGVSPATYVKQLIEDDLELDRKAQGSSLDELAAPFRTALKDVPQRDLDAQVAAARTRHRGRSSKRKS